MQNVNKPLLVRDMPGVIGLHREADFNPSRWLSEPVINWGNSKKCANRNNWPNVLNVMFCALKIAYAIGFRVVYLLGCDFSMDISQPYAFGQTKNIEGVASNNNCYRMMNDIMLPALLPHFRDADYSVFNCNPNSGLTVFPHVPYTEAIAAASDHVPQGTLSADGWYDI
jgi:hypothetical protein